ncbi:MAG: protein jag [Clostridia bacterium]|nr:protein jag [Clostridia bacterium]
MKKETIQQAKTVDAAVALGAKELGVDVSAVTYEVLEEGKRGLFGIGAAPAKVRVSYTETPDEMALNFVKTLLSDMELSVTAVMTEEADGHRIVVSGENAGVLIGHHGDTLDAIQYLANLAANKKEEDEHGYTKITVDVENYRAKREETLRQLADRMAEKVLKYNKSITLEPMNPYERRIIHSEVQKIEGVSTNSIGAENNRRIVIFPTNQNPQEKAVKEDGEGTGARENRLTGSSVAAANAAGAANAGGSARGNSYRSGQRRRPEAEASDTESISNVSSDTKPANTAGSSAGIMETAAGEEAAESTAARDDVRGNRGNRGDRSDRGERRNGGRSQNNGRRGRGERPSNEIQSQPTRPPKTVDKAEEAAAAELNAPLFERAKAEKEAAAAAEPPKAPAGPRSKKPYYMRPKNAPGTQRTYAKPVKKDSVESYYFDLENSKSGLTREKEEMSDIAKACGIYDDPVEETAAAKTADSQSTENE